MRARFGIRLIVIVAALGASVPALTTRGYADNGEAVAVLRNATGVEVGTVEFLQRGSKVRVLIDASFPAADTAFQPGFHGFHIHGGDLCTAPTFGSAGTHFNPAGATHKDHAGDMPVILVNGDRTALASFRSDRVNVANSEAPNYIVGRTVIVHFDADNYANIPTRYSSPSTSTTSGPDSGTLGTGDAGGRYACGEIDAVE